MKNIDRSKQDDIDSFIRNFRGRGIDDLENQFRELCKEKEIAKEQFNQWKKDYSMFLYENSIDAGWVAHYLLDEFEI